MEYMHRLGACCLHELPAAADYQTFELNGRTVLVFANTSANHSEAQAICRREGGDLFSPYTRQENQWMVDTFAPFVGQTEPLSNPLHVSVWIGMVSRSKTPTNDASTFVWYRTGQPPSYDSWIDGEPTARGAVTQSAPEPAGEPVCVIDIIWQAPSDHAAWPAFPGGWDDDFCKFTKAFACEVYNR